MANVLSPDKRELMLNAFLEEIQELDFCRSSEMEKLAQGV